MLKSVTIVVHGFTTIDRKTIDRIQHFIEQTIGQRRQLVDTMVARK